MKRIATVVAALAAFGLPGLASADDGLKYEDLVHCAATNIVIASVLSLNDGATKNKDDIEVSTNQAAALMTIATIGSKKDSKVVQGDVSKETDVLMDLVADKDKSSAWIEKDVPTCRDLGKAAIAVLDEAKSGK